MCGCNKSAQPTGFAAPSEARAGAQAEQRAGAEQILAQERAYPTGLAATMAATGQG